MAPCKPFIDVHTHFNNTKCSTEHSAKKKQSVVQSSTSSKENSHIVGFYYSINKVMIIKAAEPVFLQSSDAHPFYVVWFLRSTFLIYIKKIILKNLQYIICCVQNIVLKTCLIIRSKLCMVILFQLIFYIFEPSFFTQNTLIYALGPLLRK